MSSIDTAQESSKCLLLTTSVVFVRMTLEFAHTHDHVLCRSPMDQNSIIVPTASSSRLAAKNRDSVDAIGIWE